MSRKNLFKGIASAADDVSPIPTVQLTAAATVDNRLMGFTPFSEDRSHEPLPPTEEIEARYARLLEEGMIPPAKRDQLMHQSPQQKYAMIKMLESAKQQVDDSKYYVGKLINEPSIELAHKISVLIRTKPVFWVNNFIFNAGISVLLAHLLTDNGKEITLERLEIQHECINCFKSLFNNKHALETILKDKNSLRKLALAFDNALLKTKSSIMFLFSVICYYSEDGISATLDAFNHYQSVRKTNSRFSMVVNALRGCNGAINAAALTTNLAALALGSTPTSSLGSTASEKLEAPEPEMSQANQELKAFCIMLINTLISSSLKNLIRVQLRNEILNLGVLEIIRNIENSDVELIEDLAVQIRAFKEELGISDEGFMTKEMSQRVFSKIMNCVTDTGAYLSFITILQHLERISNIKDDQVKCDNWRVLEKLITGSILADNSRPYPVISDRFLNSEDKVLTQQRIIQNLESKMAKVLQKLNATGITANEGDQSTTSNRNTTTQPTGLGLPLHCRQDSVMAIRLPLSPLITPRRRTSVDSTTSTVAAALAAPAGNTEVTATSAFVFAHQDRRKLFWIPSDEQGFAVRITGSFTLDDERKSKLLELFSGQQQPVVDSQVKSMLHQNRLYAVAVKLEALKMSTRELREYILTMDEQSITMEMLNTLLEIIPSQEEADMISTFTGEPRKQLCLSDRFFWEMRDIPLLRKRLKLWKFKLEFDTTLAGIRPDIEAVLLAVKEIKRSKGLLQLIEIVLSVGNFLNGQNMRGFRLKSLLRLKDIKSVDNKTSLLEYICTIVEESYPELLTLHDELKHVQFAKNVSINDTKMSLGKIKVEIDKMRRFVSLYQQWQPDKVPSGDSFVKVMKEFDSYAQLQVEMTEQRLVKLNRWLKQIEQRFGENFHLDDAEQWRGSSEQKFFKHLDAFLNAYTDVITLRKKRRSSNADENKTMANDEAETGIVDSTEKSLKDGTGYLRKRYTRFLAGEEEGRESKEIVEPPASISPIGRGRKDSGVLSKTAGSNMQQLLEEIREKARQKATITTIDESQITDASNNSTSSTAATANSVSSSSNNMHTDTISPTSPTITSPSRSAEAEKHTVAMLEKRLGIKGLAIEGRRFIYQGKLWSRPSLNARIPYQAYLFSDVLLLCRNNGPTSQQHSNNNNTNVKVFKKYYLDGMVVFTKLPTDRENNFVLLDPNDDELALIPPSPQTSPSPQSDDIGSAMTEAVTIGSVGSPTGTRISSSLAEPSTLSPSSLSALGDSRLIDADLTQSPSHVISSSLGNTSILHHEVPSPTSREADESYSSSAPQVPALLLTASPRHSLQRSPRFSESTLTPTSHRRNRSSSAVSRHRRIGSGGGGPPASPLTQRQQQQLQAQQSSSSISPKSSAQRLRYQGSTSSESSSLQNMTYSYATDSPLKHYFVIKTFEGFEKVLEAENEVEKREWVNHLKILLKPELFPKDVYDEIYQSINQYRIVEDDPQMYYTMPLSELRRKNSYLCSQFGDDVADDASPDIVYEEKTHEILTASLPKLIQKLTPATEPDNNFLYTFMLTYKSFMTPFDFLEWIALRYNTPPPETFPTDFRTWKQTFLFPVRLRICSVLYYWIEKNGYDFRDDPELISKVKTFINKEIARTKMEHAANVLLKAMEKNVNKRDSLKSQTKSDEIQKLRQDIENLQPKIDKATKKVKKGLPAAMRITASIRKGIRTKAQYIAALQGGGVDDHSLPPSTSDSSTSPSSPKIAAASSVVAPPLPLMTEPSVAITKFKSGDIARQLTMVEFEIFKMIRPRECLNQAWNRENRSTKAPNISAMINRTNQVVHFVTNEVLRWEKLSDRQHAIKKFIKTADYCRKIGNMNAVIEIIGGLHSVPVHRLKKSWELVPPKTMQVFRELEKLVNQENNYKHMREELRNRGDTPCIPYIGMFLSDLTFIEDGNKDLIDDNINFFKRRKLSFVIRSIQRYQQLEYKFSNVPEIRNVLEDMSRVLMDETQQYKLSLAREEKRRANTVAHTAATPAAAAAAPPPPSSPSSSSSSARHHNHSPQLTHR